MHARSAGAAGARHYYMYSIPIPIVHQAAKTQMVRGLLAVAAIAQVAGTDGAGLMGLHGRSVGDGPSLGGYRERLVSEQPGAHGAQLQQQPGGGEGVAPLPPQWPQCALKLPPAPPAPSVPPQRPALTAQIKMRDGTLLNTIVFLVETAQQVAVMLVNYKGRPWMKGATENPALLYSLVACAAGVIIAAWELIPPLNSLLGLVPLPTDDMRYSLLTILGVTLFGSLLWDRLCVALFAPRIFRSQIKELLSLRLSTLIADELQAEVANAGNMTAPTLLHPYVIGLAVYGGWCFMPNLFGVFRTFCLC